MKKLIVVRHGEYVDDEGLSKNGRVQIKTLADKLLLLIESGSKVTILSSTLGYARESAQILGSVFGVEIEQHEILWSENSHPKDLPGTLELVRSYQDKNDVLILVTHYEYVQSFVSYFAMEELHTQIPSGLIDKGEAWVLDCSRAILHCVKS